jgi:hypothetical protein
VRDRWCGVNGLCPTGENDNGLCQCAPGYVPFVDSVQFNDTATRVRSNDAHPAPPQCVPTCPSHNHCHTSLGRGRCTQVNNCTVSDIQLHLHVKPSKLLVCYDDIIV